VAVTEAGHHLGDFGAMRLIGWKVEQQCHGADQFLAVERAENDALVAAG